MGTPKVLVVDSEKPIADRVLAALSHESYVIRRTASSQEGVAVAHQLKPDVLIINPVMPSLSGVEAARQISRLGAKVIFVSELAKDPDFRELMRGLMQQGCECTAVLRSFEPQELSAVIRRQIGAVEIEQGDVRPRPSSGPAAAAPARAPLPEYQPLLAFITTRMYEQNAFRLTGLRVDASLRDISKRAERLEMMAKLSGAAASAGNAEVDSPDSIRGALQSLKDPEQRLLHEMFWFWPTNETHIDAALDEINRGDLAAAERTWSETAIGQAELTAVAVQLDGPCSANTRAQLSERKMVLERVTSICLHNLAVLYHFKVLSIGTGSNSSVEMWQRAFQFWKKLHDQHRFWDVLVERIRATNDPRLTVDVAERIWTTLPLSLLTLNAALAVAAAESRKFEDAGHQRRVMNDSGFATNHVREALARKLKPLREELTRLCDNAEKEAVASPDRGDAIVRKLFESKTRYLQTFNFLLGAGDPLRDAVQDLVADAARGALVAYANKTESWETALPLFEECLALAESKSLRARLEDDIEMLSGNAAAKRASRRTQATAAVPPRATTQPNRPSPSQPTQSKPSRKPWVVIGAIVLFAIIVIVGVSNSDDTASSRGAASQATSYTGGSPTTNDQSGTVFDQAEKGLNTQKTSSAPTYNERPSSVSSSGNSFEISNLKTAIESNRIDLRRMEAELGDLDSRITALNSEIDSDKTTLERMKRQNDLGYDVDSSRYESIRHQHNNNVNEVNSLVYQYNSELRRYKALLNTTNEEIDRYNALVRSR